MEASDAPSVAAPSADAPPPPAPDDSMLCVICLHRPRSHILMPCGHYVLCTTCAEVYDVGAPKAKRQMLCPICNAQVSRVNKVFFS